MHGHLRYLSAGPLDREWIGPSRRRQRKDSGGEVGCGAVMTEKAVVAGPMASHTTFLALEAEDESGEGTSTQT